MTNAKHTPGPWRIVPRMGFSGLLGGDVTEESDPEFLMGFAGPNGERVCWFGNSEKYYPTQGDEPSEADARLIAAAPELLEALKDARYMLHGNGPGNPKIDAAIAKAEGR